MALATYSVYRPSRCAEGGEDDKVMRFDAGLLENQIKRVCKIGKEEFLRGHLDKVLKVGREKTKFMGVEQLARAAQNGDPPLLRKGQVIFGTVSHSRAQGQDGTFR